MPGIILYGTCSQYVFQPAPYFPEHFSSSRKTLEQYVRLRLTHFIQTYGREGSRGTRSMQRGAPRDQGREGWKGLVEQSFLLWVKARRSSNEFSIFWCCLATSKTKQGEARRRSSNVWPGPKSRWSVACSSSSSHREFCIQPFREGCAEKENAWIVSQFSKKPERTWPFFPRWCTPRLSPL